MPKKSPNKIFILLIFILFVVFLWNLCIGSVPIKVIDVLQALFTDNSNDTYSYIIRYYRLPKALVCILVGIGLCICGLMMQTLFRNPLAGPYTLGLSSGSSLGVAFVVLGSSLFPEFLQKYVNNNYSITFASILGSLAIMVIILFISRKIKDSVSILIVGLMFSSFTGAIVNILTYFTTAEQLQKYTFWTLGSLGNLSNMQIFILLISLIIGLALAFFIIKPLDSLLLGENYAKSMGVNLLKTRNITIIASGIISGSLTAFVGPIAFVGMAVPHITKLTLHTSSHKTLFVGNILFGSIIMLLCDIFTQMFGNNTYIPINAITSIVGAPIVIWLLVKKRKIIA
jgi:iron complex transport system permease protein